jgi:hypothetical protein
MRWWRWARTAVVLGALGLAAVPAAAETARDGLVLATAAADAWADDARLVWVENDAVVDSTGAAAAWGYLYYSPELHALRSWSVRGGRIVTALDHAVSAAAPGVDAAWLDSGRAAAAAWGASDLGPGDGRLASLLLARGVFAAGSTWVGVFESGPGPRLFVVLDACTLDLRKRWRG